MQGICAPILAIYAAPGGCNSNGNWGPFKTASTGPLVSFTLRNSTHCDGENEARGACGGFCGGAATPARQSQLARYATAFFLAHLKNDSEAFAILEESALRANGEVTDLVVRGGSNCAPVPGPGGDDAGALDAGVTDGGEGDAGGSDAGLDASPDATVQDGGDGGGSGEGGADADAGGVLDAGVDASDASLADATTPRRDAGRDAADGDDDDDGDDLDDGPKPNPRPTDAGDGVGDDGSGGDGCSCVTAGKQASGSDVALLALGILGCVGLWRRRATKTP
jgi:MYXO-CTERM domain-containing protein